MATSAAAAELTSLAKILDLANVIIHDVDGRISYWTTGCERLYGWSRERRLDKSFMSFLKTDILSPEQDCCEAPQRGQLARRDRTSEKGWFGRLGFYPVGRAKI
jgi:PAS domain-containing protein